MSIEDKIDDLEMFLKKWKEDDVLYIDGYTLDDFFKKNLNDYELQQTILTCIYGAKLIDYYSFEDFKDAFKNYDKDDIRDYLKSLELTNGESLWDLFEYFTNGNISDGGSLALDMFSRSSEVSEVVDFLLSHKNPHRTKIKKEIPVLSLNFFDELNIDWIDDRFKFYQLLKFKDLECSIYESFFTRNYEKFNTNVTMGLKELEEKFVLKTDYSYISNLLKKEHELINDNFMKEKKGKDNEFSLMFTHLLDNREKGYHQRVFFNKLLTHTQQMEPENEYDILLSSLKTFKAAKKRGHDVDEQINCFLQHINFKALEKSLITIVEKDNVGDDYTSEIVIDRTAFGVLFLLKDFESNVIIPERFNKYFDKMENREGYGFWTFNIDVSLGLILDRLNFSKTRSENSLNKVKDLELTNIGQSLTVKLSLNEGLKDCLPNIKNMIMETLLFLTKIDQDDLNMANITVKEALDECFNDCFYDIIDNEIMKIDFNVDKKYGFISEVKEKKKVLKF